ncbi:serine hydrolase domain-containing protein [Pleionea mediterranea]|uniref:CubicO group peptidase (Beta-lactamase class C family) n=1 Tax=Pleionea mediterranea TaxID=523701 RepID=A0A316G256_9GAMM|nr:serine hydrolase domain-containing protein [Pleionea mediterranea]PWK53976.1 CubicO group peptidase (beta-lactamase class C family) [Pleionea mediterranea]
MKNIVKVIPLVLLCFLVRANEQDVAGQLDAFIVEMEKQAIFSGSIAVIENGENIFSKSVGYADASKAKPVEKYAVFNIGSISKGFTAMSILLLVEDNKLQLENSLSTYFPELPNWAEKITISHLLSHSSGLPANGYQPDLDNTKIIPELRTVTEIEFQPGEDTLYGSYGYQLLAMVVERITEQPFGAFVQDRIFVPLNMKYSYVLGTEPRTTAQLAIGYEFGRGNVPQDFTTGASNVYSNVSDLLKWERALSNNALVKQATLQQALTPSKCWGNDCRLNADFGIGVYKNDELWGIHHHGGFGGYQSMLYRFPEKNRAIVFTANNGLELQYNDIRFTLISILDGESPAYPKKDAHIMYYDVLMNKGLDEAKSAYISMRKKSDIYDVNEKDINSIGYFLLGNNHAELAVETFKFCSEQFPDSANIWDSYGEALETAKDIKGARHAYEKALKLATANQNEKLAASIKKNLQRVNALTELTES